MDENSDPHGVKKGGRDFGRCGLNKESMSLGCVWSEVPKDPCHSQGALCLLLSDRELSATPATVPLL